MENYSIIRKNKPQPYGQPSEIFEQKKPETKKYASLNST